MRLELIFSGGVDLTVHQDGGQTPLVLAALTRIEGKLGELAGNAAQQQKIDELTRKLQEQHDDTAAFVDANKPKG